MNQTCHPDPATHPGSEPVNSNWEGPPDAHRRVAQMAEYLDRCEADLVHPGRVDAQLRRQGWSPGDAQAVTETYRRRFNEHILGYSALLVATGVTALAAGTVGHYLTNGLNGPVHRQALAFWLAVLICTAPFAVWAHLWAARVDRNDPVAVWSQPRRTLAQILLWASGVVGGLRLLIYATQLSQSIVNPRGSGHHSVAAGLINVAISTVIALPLGLWSYRFLHRFDREDPTAVPEERHRDQSPPRPS
jgi:hypothetical protein